MNNNNILALDARQSMRRKDDNGFLHVQLTPISKAAVNPYLGREIPGWQEKGLEADGIYYGFRAPEELAKAASSFNGLPLLLDHHIESAQQPQKEYRVGSTGTDAVFEDPYLKNSLAVTDLEAVQAIEDGSRAGLSCAYRYEPDWTAGEHEGVAYDFVMRKISGNHVALVHDGRAGPEVVVADSSANLPTVLKNTEEERKQTMNTRFRKKTWQKKVMALDTAIQAAGVDDPQVKKAMADVVNTAEEMGKEEQAAAADSELDLSLSPEEIIKANAPGLAGEELAFVKMLLGKLKEQTAQDEELPEDKVAEDDDGEKINLVAAALKAIPNDELWSGLNALMNKVDAQRAKDVLSVITQALGTAAPAAADSDEKAAEMKQEEQKALAQDANTIKAAAVAQVLGKVRRLNAAAKECSFILGNMLDPLAFDSAEDIYAAALRQEGIDVKAYPKAAYKGMVDMKRNGQPMLAADAKPPGDDEATDEIFQNLLKIKEL